MANPLVFCAELIKQSSLESFKEKENMLRGPILKPESGKADSLIIFCHGYGSNGDDLISLGVQFRPVLPKAIFIAPNAPEKSPHPGGFQWFPISSFSKEERIEGAYKAAPMLAEFIEESLTKYNILSERLALVGFSQGAMMALHVGLRRKNGLAGILGFSGALAAPANLVSEMQCKPPIFLAHGAQDNVIPFPALFETIGALEAAGLNVEKHLSYNAGHSIPPDSIEKGRAFLARILG